MPKLTETQNATLNIIDLLFIRDMESLSSFRNEKNIYYRELLDHIEDIASHRKHDGKVAELYKHYILCGLEMLFNRPWEIEDDADSDLVDKLDFVLEKLINKVKKDNFLDYEFLSDIIFLAKKYDKFRLDKGLTYNLVSDLYYFEYDSSAIAAYKHFLDLGILSTEKYSLEKSKIDISLLEKTFLRSMLLIEFEIIKKQFNFKKNIENNKLEIDLSLSIVEIEQIFISIKSIKKARLLLEEDFDQIFDINLKNKKQVEHYLVNLSERLDHKTIFFKNIPVCTGLIGCWFLILFKETDLSRPFYYKQFEEFTKPTTKRIAAKEASNALKEYGFDIEPKTLYMHYIKFYDSYDEIRFSSCF